MSFVVDLKDLSMEQKKFIKNNCIVESPETQYADETKMECFRITSGKVFLPFGLWKRFLNGPPIYKGRKSAINIDFTGVLLTRDTDIKKRDQDVIAAEALRSLKENRTCFLALATSTGKTCLSAYLTVMLKKKTVFLCYLDSVNRQTVKQYEKFTNAKVQHVKNDTLDPDADVYIIGLRKAFIIWQKNNAIFNDIGFLILDEAHLQTQFVFTKLAFVFRPDYFLGMSATPDRKDGQHIALDLFFGIRSMKLETSRGVSNASSGPDKKTGIVGQRGSFDLTISVDPMIVRIEKKDFVVIKVKTAFKPDMSKKIYVRGKYVTDWTNAVTSLVENEERTKLIVDIIMKNYTDHKILVLGGRVKLCNDIYEALLEAGVSTDLLVGNKKTYDQSVDVLVGGVKKIGIGFDDPTRTLLIMAADLTDVRQTEGRIRTVNNIVYDIVDADSSFERHWKMRLEWYKIRGAKVVDENGQEIFIKPSAGNEFNNDEFLKRKRLCSKNKK